MILHAVTHNAAFTVISRFRTWCAFVGCWLVSVNGIAQQVFVAPGVTQIPVNRIQAPGYIPPPPIVRRPWWFTVQTVSGPGAVVPVPRVTRYQPQPFRFPPAAPVLAGKPITPPTSTFPSQWAAAPPITPSSPITQKTVPAPPSSWQPSIPLPREEVKPTPPKPSYHHHKVRQLKQPHPHRQGTGQQLQLMQAILSQMPWPLQFLPNQVEHWQHNLITTILLKKLQYPLRL